MISLEELNPKNFEMTKEQQDNLAILHKRINLIRAAWGKPMYVTTGFRTLDEHKRIYREIASKKGVTAIRIPMGSQHLKGGACDIADRRGALMEWCKNNIEILDDAELWCEDGTNGWVHFQIVPPASGKRFFKP